MLALVGLASAGRQSVKTYSLGMRQRLGLTGALLGDPDLLVLDEPANGFDTAGVARLPAVLRGFADHGGTVLASSHLLAEVDEVADGGDRAAQRRRDSMGPGSRHHHVHPA